MKESSSHLLCPVCGNCGTYLVHNTFRRCSRCNMPLGLLSNLACPVCFSPVIYSCDSYYPCSNIYCPGYYIVHTPLSNLDFTLFHIGHTHILLCESDRLDVVNQSFTTLKEDNITGEINFPSPQDNPIYLEGISMAFTLQSYSDSCFISRTLIKIAKRLRHERISA